MNKTLEKLAEVYTSALTEKFNDKLFWQKPQENNIAYLKGWLESMKQDPLYIYNVLADAKAVTRFVSNHFGIDYRYTADYESSDDYFRLYCCITGVINDNLNSKQ